jgi:hypothetical protein
MDLLERIDWEILDATADDWENLEQIYLIVCYEVTNACDTLSSKATLWRRKVTESLLLSEIADRVRGLVERGLMAAVNEEDGCPVVNKDDLSYIWRAWFRMTAQGKALWESSEYATPAEQEQPQ